MKKASECENIEDVRQAIDSIDQRIVQLIAERSQYVFKAASFKKSPTAVRDESRVAQVIESKKRLAIQYGASPDLVADLYKLMIDFFIAQEMDEWKRSLGN